MCVGDHPPAAINMRPMFYHSSMPSKAVIGGNRSALPNRSALFDRIPIRRSAEISVGTRVYAFTMNIEFRHSDALKRGTKLKGKLSGRQELGLVLPVI
jgi:hypothetical protein